MRTGPQCPAEAPKADEHLGLAEDGGAPLHHDDLSSSGVPEGAGEESYINAGASIVPEVQNEASDYDTLGIRYDEIPELGGVLPDAERSVGGVSEITSPSHYVPVNQVNVPALPLNEVLNPIIDVGGHQQSLEQSRLSSICDSDVSCEDGRRSKARRSLQAGLEAQERGAFDSAAALFLLGRKELGSDGWEVDGETMLKLCSEGAHASYIIDDFDTMNQLIDEVLGRDLSVQEKFRVYEVKMLVEQGLGNYHKSIALGFDVRRQLGLPTLKDRPASMLSIMIGYARTSRALGNRTAEELANLPMLTDERITMGQRMLELLEISCYQVSPV